MKTLLFLFIVLHGVIHLLGLVKSLGLWAPPGYEVPVGTESAILWGLAGLLMWVFGLLYLMGSPWQVWAGLLAMALSQGLIIGAWSDARWGTLANLLVFLLVALAWGRTRRVHPSGRNILP